MWFLLQTQQLIHLYLQLLLQLKKKDAKIYDEAVKIESVTATTITIQVLENTPSTNMHTYIRICRTSSVSGGNYTHQFASGGTNSVKKALTPVQLLQELVARIQLMESWYQRHL